MTRYLVTCRHTGADRFDVIDTQPVATPDTEDEFPHGLPDGLAMFVASARTLHTASRIAELLNADERGRSARHA